MSHSRFSIIFLAVLTVSKVTNSALIYTSGPNKCPTGELASNSACCALFPVVKLMQDELFEGGQCNEEITQAHSALRLSFHDAIGYSLLGGKGGGADGSILAFQDIETAYAANGGIDEITADQYPIWKKTELSAGDFVHLAAAVGTANCVGAPRLQYQFGRPPPRAPAPDFTVPEPTDSVTWILERFADAGFSPEEAVALLASHTIAAVDVIDPTIPGTPLDSTVDTFDSQIFLEVLLKGTMYPGNGSHPGEVPSPIHGEMRLQSDFAISQDFRTSCYWQLMINDQERMMSQFKAAMAKLQALGQNNLIDCSDVVPVPKPFAGPIKYPATFSREDVQVACPTLRFPKLETAHGPAPRVSPVPS